MKKSPKLRLQKETLRALCGVHLTRVIGGADLDGPPTALKECPSVGLDGQPTALKECTAAPVVAPRS